jgi:hypothetical protein
LVLNFSCPLPAGSNLSWEADSGHAGQPGWKKPHFMWIHALGQKPIRQAEFELPRDWPYARLEIEDAAGKRAWSNPLWVFN